MRYFIFGLQRSGTNFLEQLLAKNFSISKINRTNRCWKHSIDIPKGYQQNELTILIYKNPYTWCESLCCRNNVDWIKTQKTYPATEGEAKFLAGKNRFNVANLAKTYKHWHESWTQSNVNGLVIKYEDLLVKETREQFLEKIKAPVRKSDTWQIPQIGKVSQSRDYTKQREQYYLEMKPTKLNQEQIEAITETIGVNMIRKIGYNPI